MTSRRQPHWLGGRRELAGCTGRPAIDENLCRRRLDVKAQAAHVLLSRLNADRALVGGWIAPRRRVAPRWVVSRWVARARWRICRRRNVSLVTVVTRIRIRV